jgi:large subunit ribosomal protein L25
VINITGAPSAAQVEAELAEAEAEAGIEPTVAEGTEVSTEDAGAAAEPAESARS